MLILDLPFPNSTNTHWRKARGITYISAQGKAFRTAVAHFAGLRGAIAPKGRLSVGVELFPPDKRVRDIDNYGGKTLLDALTHAGVIEDDSLVDELRIVRRTIVKGGMCRVFISSYIDRSNDMTLEYPQTERSST